MAAEVADFVERDIAKEQLSMKVGLIGAGRQGWRRAAALKQTGLGDLAFVSDLSLRAANRVKNEFGCESSRKWRDVIHSDVDVVVISTPPDTHAQILKAALKQNKHVLCEKPLARTLREAIGIQKAASRRRVTVKCGFNYRFHPAIVQARAWVRSGKIGDLCYARCVHGITGRTGYERDWRVRPHMSGGGQLIDQGIHCLDLFRCFMGDFSEGLAFLGTFFWKIPVEDNAFAVLRTSKGTIASLHTSWTEWRNLFRIEFFGTEGYVKVEGLGESYGTERAVLGKRDFSRPFAEKTIEYRGHDVSWQTEWRNFINSIKIGTQPDGSLVDGVRALAMTDALYASARSGRIAVIEKA